MQNYEAMILQHFSGTPKEKYECLLSLEKENARQKGTIEHLKTFLEAIKVTPDDVQIKSLRSIFDAYQKTILEK